MIFYNSIHVQGVLYLGMEIVCFEASLIFHLDIRKLLVEFIGLNCSLFRASHSLSMKVTLTRNNYVWGTHAEVFAPALYFSIPVSVAMERSNREYYWAKYI